VGCFVECVAMKSVCHLFGSCVQLVHMLLRTNLKHVCIFSSHCRGINASVAEAEVAIARMAAINSWDGGDVGGGEEGVCVCVCV